jgi:hypothetical protein
MFRILCDSPTDGAALVLACPDLPELGDTWESVDGDGTVTDVDLDAFCIDRRAVANSQELYHEWIVTISYAGRGDPLLEPAEVTVTNAKYQIAIQEDANGTTIMNSAGDPFASGLTKDRTRFTINITQNVLYFDIVEASTLIDTVNADPMFFSSNPPGFEPGVCKLSGLSAAIVWKENLTEVDYWRRTAIVEISPEGWQAVLLDQGFHKVLDGTKSNILTAGGGKVSSPQLLDGLGWVLGGGSPVYLPPFVLYPPADWSGLGLDWIP